MGFEWIYLPEAWVALLTLTALEIVLGIDNIIFISILVGRLPEHQRQRARIQGLALAMITRILLLLSLACPYRMRQNEIQSVSTLIADWARHCHLHNGTDRDASGHFTCHLESDQPPHYLHDEQRRSLDSDWLIFDTHGLEQPV